MAISVTDFCGIALLLSDRRNKQITYEKNIIVIS